MRLYRQTLLWVLVGLALIGCQRAPAPSTETVPPTKAPPTPTKTLQAPTPTPLPLINGNSEQVPTLVAPEVPRITIDELKAMLSSARNVLVIDTRDPDAYETAHIRGAINVSYSKVEAIAPQLSRSAKIVFYCA
jgi:hypothetical protein